MSVTLRLITDGSLTGDIWFDDISLIGPGGTVVTLIDTNTPMFTPTNTQAPTVTATATQTDTSTATSTDVLPLPTDTPTETPTETATP
jgi:hypothetical protein